MKRLIIAFALFSSSLSYADNYTFKQSQFTVTAVLKSTDNDATKPAPAFTFTGLATWTENADGYSSPTAQITIRRTTYNCDEADVDYDNNYSCSLNGATLLQILDEVATRDEKYADAVALLKNYYDNTYYGSFSLSLGNSSQTATTSDTNDVEDADGSNMEVETTVTTSGMHPI